MTPWWYTQGARHAKDLGSCSSEDVDARETPRGSLSSDGDKYKNRSLRRGGATGGDKGHLLCFALWMRVEKE